VNFTDVEDSKVLHELWLKETALALDDVPNLMSLTAITFPTGKLSP